MKSGRTAVVAALAVLVLGGATLPAMADPDGTPSQQEVDAARRAVAAKKHSVEGIQATLAAAKDRVEAAQMAAAEAGEAYNGAMYRLQLAQDAAAKAEAASVKADRTLRSHKAAYTDLIANTYEEQPQLHALSALTGQGNPQDMIDAASTTYQVSTAMDDIEVGYQKAAAAAAQASDKAAAARADAADLAGQAKAARDRAQAAADHASAEATRVAQQRTKMLAELAQLQHISVDLAARRQAAIEEARRKAAAAAAAAAAKAAQEAAAKAAAEKAAQQAANDKGGSSPGPGPSAPPVSSGGIESVIAYAQAQLGEWYLWGAAGPDRWDCSGLTMMAFRQAGIYLPHFSGAQYDAGTPIPVSSARRGDLLFWTSNGSPSGIHHVAIYLGNDQVIEAPHAGAQVRIRSLEFWYPDFAVRL